MSLNSLKIATSGYLKRQTKAVLIIAVSGYLNYQAPPIPPIPPSTPKQEQILGLGKISRTLKVSDDEREKRIKIEDSEIIVIVELTLKRFII